MGYYTYTQTPILYTLCEKVRSAVSPTHFLPRECGRGNMDEGTHV